jgi:polysaccharide deacetylase 2 family uncharacterized protein YibQ
MADDLSAPLGRKRGSKPRPGLKLEPGKLPLARVAFGLAALVVVGVVARVVVVNDPMGGRPVAEIGIAHKSNPLVDSLTASSAAAPGMATITAGPEMPAGDASIAALGSDATLDPAAPAMALQDAAVQGLKPDLLEESEHGAIPRMSATGETPFQAYAQPVPNADDGKPQIAIVVTGLGLNASGTTSAIDTLPPAVTLAFAPYGKTVGGAASTARAAGHEILLEVPLEPFDYPESDPGPDTLLTGTAPRDNLNKLFTVMGSFGGYVGLINHMGARFTASTADFAPIMEELGARGLGYLDDGSSNRSVARQLAAANTVAFGRADLALDATPARASILDQLKALEQKATDKGSAIGVISALPVSLTTLAEWSKSAEDRGFTLVPVSARMKKPA